MPDSTTISQFARVSDLLASRGWAEANAGNLSVRITDNGIDGNESTCDELPLKTAFPSLDGQVFLVTATKSRARDVSRDPEGNIGLVQIINDGSACRCLWGKVPPTSEFPAHLAIYSECRKHRPEINAVLHTHPPNIIAMSHLPGMKTPGTLNRNLRKMHPEVPVLVPDGIMEMPYEIPGSIELGFATSDALLKSRVAVWPMHGVVSIAEDVDKALDQIEILEKAAMIYRLVLSTGREPVGLSDNQIIESREYWGITDGIE